MRPRVFGSGPHYSGGQAPMAFPVQAIYCGVQWHVAANFVIAPAFPRSAGFLCFYIYDLAPYWRAVLREILL